MVTLRIRSIVWFISGVTLAVVSVWALSALKADAINPAESSIISVTPERILDTRDPNNLGLAGPFLSTVPLKLQVTGTVPTINGPKQVVPVGASGVVLNVTPVSATRDGFISVEPGDATGVPTTSNVNFTAGSINPNSVTVSLPTVGPDAGKIRITYDAFGLVGPFTDILIDVVGYTTNAGLTELTNRVRALETFGTTIPSGVTVTGNIWWDEDSHGGSDDYRLAIDLPGRAPVALSDAKVNFAPDGSTATVDDDPLCTGTSSTPTAPAGSVCIYRINSGAVSNASGNSLAGGSALTDKTFYVHWMSVGTGDMYVYATWAYTAP